MLCAGALVFCVASSLAGDMTPPASSVLAAQLYEEGDWAGCEAECLRSIQFGPSTADLRLMRILSSIRRGNPHGTALHAELTRSPPAANPDLIAEAHVSLGREAWRRGETNAALSHLSAALVASGSSRIVTDVRACFDDFVAQSPDVEAQAADLALTLRTFAPTLNRPPPARRTLSGDIGRVATAPLRSLIRFYQTQIGPAIGTRCSLRPSCSRYAVEALRRHGLLGLALIADRTVREPSEVAAQENPVRVDGRILYRDPVEQHDSWLNK